MMHTYIKHPRSKGYSWNINALCKAYDWPAKQPGGGVIAIVELGGGWLQSDVDLFFASNNLPAPVITDVSVDGTANSRCSPQQDADGEVGLDIQIAGAAYAIATGEAANIRVYWAQDIAPALKAAMQDGCDVFSCSWGNDEAAWLAQDQTSLADMEATAAAAVAAGMVVFSASGDNDSSDGGSTPANVDAPASCPHVIGCGGTSKPTFGEEVVWNNNPGNADGEGTGGGFSTYFPQQPWQAGAPHGPGKMVPDVAGNADPQTGYTVVQYGQVQQGVGGTSAVAPLYAGLFAAFGKKLGFVPPTMWHNHMAFRLVTHGDNGQYRASDSPNPCCGLGSPIGTKLAALFANLT